jgi:predicted HD phosphohydrolase
MPVLVLTHMDEDNKTDNEIKKEFEFTGAQAYMTTSCSGCTHCVQCATSLLC